MLLKRPSAFVPVLMSLAALTMVLVHFAMYGIVEETDEGTPAHVFQLLMAGQLPVILYFAIRYLPQMPKQAAGVLALQFVAGVAAVVSVLLFTGG